MTDSTKKISKKTRGKIRVDDILRRVDRLPDLNSFTSEEIIGYDQNGLPQSESPKHTGNPLFPKLSEFRTPSKSSSSIVTAIGNSDSGVRLARRYGPNSVSARSAACTSPVRWNSKPTQSRPLLDF